MTGTDQTSESAANTLCKSCGLCCTGHLFIWAKLKPPEMDPAEALGLHVFRSDPRHRGFSQPCPLWEGQCAIYHSPHYPYFCRTYKCKLLKQVLDETTPLPEALALVEQAKGMIREVEAFLPAAPKISFRERLVAHFERLERLKSSTGQEDPEPEFRSKAGALLLLYKKVFGVKDVVDQFDET